MSPFTINTLVVTTTLNTYVFNRNVCDRSHTCLSKIYFRTNSERNLLKNFVKIIKIPNIERYRYMSLYKGVDVVKGNSIHYKLTNSEYKEVPL